MPCINIDKLDTALQEIIGKTLDGVVVTENTHARFQIFLLFTDGTHYEFYGAGDIDGARSASKGDPKRMRSLLSKQAVVTVPAMPELD